MFIACMEKEQPFLSTEARHTMDVDSFLPLLPQVSTYCDFLAQDSPTSKEPLSAFPLVRTLDKSPKITAPLLAIPLDSMEKQHLYSPWQRSIIIRVLGRKFGYRYQYIYTKLQSLWKLSEDLSMMDLGNAFYLIHFQLDQSYDTVLMNGPWFIGQHFLSIRAWNLSYVRKLLLVKQILFGHIFLVSLLSSMIFKLFKR